MRVWLYEVLTQIIVLVGTLRSNLIPWDKAPWEKTWEIRRDRTFYANSFESWECCDCGAWHLTRPLPDEEPRFPAFRFIPVRPRGYQYRLRHTGTPSSPFENEAEKASE